jgi:hypothetical protein
MTEAGAIYVGEVVHKRLRPRPHALEYRVFSLLLDVDRIGEALAPLRLLSRNRFNLLGFHDSDHGPGDGTPVAVHARRVLAEAGIATGGARILLLAYPRVLGYVFNPISVYYVLDAAGRLSALLYEVNNTWGGRTSYAVRAGEPTGRIFHQSARKKMEVSPFADRSGRYAFRVNIPGDELVLGVQLRDPVGPLIKTHFKAAALPLTDGVLARLSLRLPLMTMKVIGAIHLEAFKLWAKGVPLASRQHDPATSAANAEAGREGAGE